MPHRRILSTRGLWAALVTTLLLSIGLAAVVGSGDSRDKRIVPPDATAMHPVAAEIHALRDAQTTRLRELNARARMAEDPNEELALQREIQQVKLDGEIAMYEIQLRHAESRADAKTAAMLREVLAAYQALGQRHLGEDFDLPARETSEEEVAP
jgi:hypothetical protein